MHRKPMEPVVMVAAALLVVQVEVLDLIAPLGVQAYLARVAVAGQVEIMLVALVALATLKYGSTRNESGKN